MLDGDHYVADDPEIIEDQRRAVELIAAFNTAPPGDDQVRHRILTRLLGGIGPGTVVRPPFHCDLGYRSASAPAVS